MPDTATIDRYKRAKHKLKLQLEKANKQNAYYLEVIKNLKAEPVPLTDSQLQAKNAVLTQQLKESIEKNQDLHSFNDDLEEQLSEALTDDNGSAVLAQIKELLL